MSRGRPAPLVKFQQFIQLFTVLLTAILISLFFGVLVLVGKIQGTARVVNYAGLVRGKTQRIVKLEISGQPQDGMIADSDAFIAGLRFGSDKLSLVRLNDDAFQSKMQELDDYFQALKQEIGRVRAVGSNNTDIIPISETFFGICDDATGLAEAYSQRKATSLSALEKYITADIVVLMLLIGYQLFQALHTAAMNRALQHKVYLDAATGLPNKNKCEELLDDPTPPAPETGVCSFDLNNLRRINNSMGHEAGDAYIRRFAVALRAAMPEEHLVGRAGGDEFLAITHGPDADALQKLLSHVRKQLAEESRQHPDTPLSYAAGFALASDNPDSNMRDLFDLADKNMYINKNHVKREEAAAEKRLDFQLLKQVNRLHRSFSDCLYCDAMRVWTPTAPSARARAFFWHRTAATPAPSSRLPRNRLLKASAAASVLRCSLTYCSAACTTQRIPSNCSTTRPRKAATAV